MLRKLIRPLQLRLQLEIVDRHLTNDHLTRRKITVGADFFSGPIYVPGSTFTSTYGTLRYLRRLFYNDDKQPESFAYLTQFHQREEHDLSAIFEVRTTEYSIMCVFS